ncbi:strawberry notch C-terminal domain-containing protein [Nodosilinea nodulosa]|uniref:strawberry notch C-terminal domain-containing protein n=1 Tax=Nodosilinea nodulosa TaxID=416001 RepID=UPI00031A3551|nr:strawberry notch C-terminal domain-containing protein [Nodosilinea nodulosa]
MQPDAKEQLIQHFRDRLLAGVSYARITEARREATDVLGQLIIPGDPLTKVVDEAMEAAVVRASGPSIAQCPTTYDAYDRLVDLLEQQPNLTVRSSTSVLQQAYSTPVPIAYLASVLADITPETWVYEPTAGNGALLIGANPEKVMANEINGDRLAELQTRGYRQLTQHDATSYQPQKPVDRIICNPPFGSVKGANHRTQRFPIADTWTTQVDQAIALKALEAMKDNGRAVLILGGKKGIDPELRSERYNTRESRAFFYVLYNQYAVTDHFSISGDLYRKQGAGFPIDVIVIAGRGPSTRHLPAAQVPDLKTTFAELKETLPHGPIRHLSPDLGTAPQQFVVRGESASEPASSRRADLQSPDGGTPRRNDSELARHRDPRSHSNPAGPWPERSASLPGLSTANPERPGDLQPMGLAAGVGGSLHSPQLNLQRSSLANGNGANHLPDDAIFTDPDPIRAASGSPSRHPPGSLAHGPERHPSALGKDIPMEISPESNTTSTPEDAYAQPKQVAYLPKSQGVSSQTLIPFNMVSAAQAALDNFEQRHGDIDEYLATRLGYASIQELHQYFSAEQVDTSALAIDNLERGQGFITGDQTGIGKGRICASIMRYAQQQGKHAIFVTKDKTLYADMMRDVSDIGTHQFHPFATDINIQIPLPNGGELLTGRGAQQEKAMLEMMRSGTLNNHSAIFTTYSQLQTVGKKEPLRREFLRALAPNAILILDEAHEAGGTKNEWQLKNQAPDRAEFVRQLIDLSSGVFYSSATYAKRPDVMDLYARRTDLRLAVSSMDALENILTRGGVPLQQMVASKFVASGQMLRRERSYDGVSFEAKVVPVEREVADEFSAAMRAIKDFDRAKQKAVKELDKELKKEAKALGDDNAIGEVGAKSTNFTSLMHNCIEQGLLAQKSEATVQEAIHSLQNGQKPVIAVANTMGSFIQGYADAHDLKHGDRLDLSFSNLLERYLERSRDVVLRNYKGQSDRHRLTDTELGDEGLFAYEDALESIREGDFSRIPISPIDYIEQRLEQAGYRISEVTGRKAGLDYAPDGTTTYKVRTETETSSKAKIEAVALFNAGDADAILLNCSGSTGISLHASEKFADQRPRHMIVAQAERDINVFMQMLGRIHRTGQVELPSYTLLMGDLPAEKRPGAILCRKMASLNANTTASRETDISISNVVDFMNAYGEQVVNELLSDDLELNAQLDFPTLKAQNDGSEVALIKRVTGAIPLLPIEQQEAVYDLIESEYKELVDQARAMGESILEADQLDLDARTTARMEVIPDDSPVKTEFTGPVYLEIVDAKSASKPLTQLQAVNVLREGLGLEAVKTLEEHDPEVLEAPSKQRADEAIAALTEATEQYRTAVLATKKEESAANKFSDRLDKQFDQVSSTLEQFPSGTPVRIVSGTTQSVFYGVVSNIDQKIRPGSPAAPNNWKMRLLVADSARQITVPLSKLNSWREGAVNITPQAQDWFGNDVYSLFDKFQQSGRVERQIFTGNIIKAFEKYPKGKLVNFTDHQGQVRQGLVMPKEFDIREELDKEPVAFKQGYQVKAFLTDLTSRRGAVKTLDELLILKAQANGDSFVLQAPKAKESGAKYFLDEALIASVGNDFHSVADRMEVVVPPERLEQTLTVLMNQRQYTLAAFDHKDIARDYLGIQLPKLEVIDAATPAPTPVREPQPLLPPLSPVSTQPTPSAGGILPPKQQQGQIEKRIANFLEKAGIREVVTVGEDYHLKIENEPYIPLVVERQLDELYLTHYLEQNGDTFIDTEMVFKIQGNGQLRFKEIATQDPIRGGELRAPDRLFAQTFSRNIQHQGFAEAAKQQLQAQSVQSQADVTSTVQPTPAASEPSSLKPEIKAYLDLKAQHPDALLLTKTADGRFYEAFMADARALAEKTEVILTSTDSGSPELGRVPVTGFPVHAKDRYLEWLRQSTPVVMVDGSEAIEVHPQIEPSENPVADPVSQASEAPAIPDEPISPAIALAPEIPLTAEEQPSLFSLETFEGTAQPLTALVQGDPAWNQTESPQSPDEKPVEAPLAVEETQSPPPTTAQPTIDVLRQWYRHARDVGRSEKHLKQIEVISRGAMVGQALGDRDLQAMTRDESAWQAQITTVTEQARSILNLVGTQDSEGQHFSGKTYQIHGNDHHLSIAATGRGDLLNLEQGQITLSQITHVDAQRFQTFAELIQSRALIVQTAQRQPAGLEP